MRDTLRQLLPAVVVAGFLGSSLNAPPAKAITTPSIINATASSQCLDYSIVGVCFWLYCGWTGCSVRTSLLVRHYVPELVVSSYEKTGENPWSDMVGQAYSVSSELANFLASSLAPSTDAMGGGQNTSDAEPRYRQSLRFKHADVVGHPGGAIFNQFASGFGFACQGAAQAFYPYYLSTLDSLAWRSGIPESAYPEALIPGRRELGQTSDLWGNVYPRSGFIAQTHDYKAAALTAQRSADIVTRTGQPHVYFPLIRNARDGWWPPDPIVEGNSDHRWQQLQPNMSRSCHVWPDRSAQDTYADRLAEDGDYVLPCGAGTTVVSVVGRSFWVHLARVCLTPLKNGRDEYEMYLLT
ncbi:TIGR03756 family integrating conjugative element protein [Vreelandella olivaria]|uniref:TIGR03756 family integrating conjugative element protein n=1 Tax=Vreelandella olivaria TaxID=390919 RepID=UPI003CC91F2D